MDSKNELLLEYLDYLKAKGRRARTVTGHGLRVGRLLRYLEETGLEYGEVRVKEAQEYQGYLIRVGRKDGKSYVPGSVRNHLKTAITFFEFLKSKGLAAADPFLEIKKIRAEKPLPKNVLKEKEMSLVLEGLADFTKPGHFQKQKSRYRAHVMAEVMYSTGMRIGEVARLREEDINIDKGTITLHETKDGRDRVVFLNEYAREVLRLYLAIRADLFTVNSKRSKVFGAGEAQLIVVMKRELKEVCGALGLPGITSHGFRHAFGFHLLRSGLSIRYIQELLGHRRLSSTEVYTRVEKEDLRAVLDRFHPRRWGHEDFEVEGKPRDIRGVS